MFRNPTKILQRAVLCAALLLAIGSCRKPEKDFAHVPGANTAHRAEDENNNENTFIRSDESEKADPNYLQPTIIRLGRKYNNPFSVSVVMQAWNELSPNQINSLQPTHHYVKFSPTTLDQLKELANSGIPLFTFPMDQEVLQYGEYMTDPNLSPNSIPELYTCLPATSPIPNAPYQILDELYLMPYESIVTERAFHLAGEDSMYAYDRTAEPDAAMDVVSAGATAPPVDADDKWGIINNGTPNGESVLKAASIPPPPGPTPVPDEVANYCGCNLNSDDRKPSGCIKVEETRFGPSYRQGVNDVMVEFLGPFFQYDNPRTNKYGCFKSDRKMRYKIFGKRLPVLSRVGFVSWRKTVKGLKDANILNYALPMTDFLGNVAPGGLNNIQVTYLRATDRNTKACMLYVGSHANNGIYEYDGYAQQDGIYTPPANLQIIVHKYAGSAATPMFHKMLAMGSPGTVIAFAFLQATMNGLPGVGTWGIQQILVAFPPDVAIGYNYPNNQLSFETDRLKEVIYHEYGHGSHFVKCGPQLWEQNIAFVAGRQLAGNNPPYGTGTASGSDRCALIEMWGYHIGLDYTDRRYGPTRHSIDPSPTFINSWYSVEEKIRYFDSYYIPGGLPRDLIDNGFNAVWGIPENAFVTDTISNFTNAKFFAEMGPLTTDMQTWKSKLKTNQLPSTGAFNTISAYNALFKSYNY